MDDGQGQAAVRARLMDACSRLVGTNQLSLLDYLWHSDRAAEDVAQRVERDLVEALGKARGDPDSLVHALTAATQKLKEAIDSGQRRE